MHIVYSDRLLIGNAFEARNLKLLYEHRIEAIVDLSVNDAPARPGREMLYCRIPLIDGEGNSQAMVEMAIRCLVPLIQLQYRTLVSCNAAMSCCPAIAAAALGLVTGQRLDECLKSITSFGPHDVSPTFWPSVCQVFDGLLAASNHRDFA